MIYVTPSLSPLCGKRKRASNDCCDTLIDAFQFPEWMIEPVITIYDISSNRRFCSGWRIARYSRRNITGNAAYEHYINVHECWWESRENDLCVCGVKQLREISQDFSKWKNRICLMKRRVQIERSHSWEFYFTFILTTEFSFEIETDAKIGLFIKLKKII